MQVVASRIGASAQFSLPLDSSNDEAYSLPHDSICPKPARREDCRDSIWRCHGPCGHARIGNNLIESVITKRSADEMKLKVGDKVSAVIKSTEVMLEKD